MEANAYFLDDEFVVKFPCVTLLRLRLPLSYGIVAENQDDGATELPFVEISDMEGWRLNYAGPEVFHSPTCKMMRQSYWQLLFGMHFRRPTWLLRDAEFHCLEDTVRCTFLAYYILVKNL